LIGGWVDCRAALDAL